MPRCQRLCEKSRRKLRWGQVQRAATRFSRSWNSLGSQLFPRVPKKVSSVSEDEMIHNDSAGRIKEEGEGTEETKERTQTPLPSVRSNQALDPLESHPPLEHRHQETSLRRRWSIEHSARWGKRRCLLLKRERES